MQLMYGIRHILFALLLCIRIGQYIAVPPPLHLPIFDMIYMRSNNFNESIMDTVKYMSEYDFIIIGSGSGKWRAFDKFGSIGSNETVFGDLALHFI